MSNKVTHKCSILLFETFIVEFIHTIKKTKYELIYDSIEYSQTRKQCLFQHVFYFFFAFFIVQTY